MKKKHKSCISFSFLSVPIQAIIIIACMQLSSGMASI